MVERKLSETMNWHDGSTTCDDCFQYSPIVYSWMKNVSLDIGQKVNIDKILKCGYSFWLSANHCITMFQIEIITNVKSRYVQCT